MLQSPPVKRALSSKIKTLPASPRVPADLNQRYPALLQSFDLPFYDFNGLFYKLEPIVNTDDELTEKELKQIEADDQAIQTILLGLPKDIYAAVDSSDIGIQEKKAKLFNEWERFTSNEGESIESYYHRFLKLMNDLKNKHFSEKIASNLKFLNNLQPEWSRHVTIVHQTKDLHTADYTQLYDFLKCNQKEVDELKVERLAKIQDPLALMVNSNNPYAFLAPQPSYNQNYMQQPMPNSEDITDPTPAMNMALVLMAKNGLIGVSGNANLNGNGNLVAACAEGNEAGHNRNQIRCYNCRGVGHFARNCMVKPRRRDATYLQTHLLIAQKEEAGIQLQAKEFDLMVAAADLDEIEEYTKLLEPIPEPHQVLQNDNPIISEDSSVEQSGKTVEQHPENFKETRAPYDSLQLSKEKSTVSFLLEE
nr:hypothetical protein [Tanacetum cinerariifolium]